MAWLHGTIAWGGGVNTEHESIYTLHYTDIDIDIDIRYTLLPSNVAHLWHPCEAVWCLVKSFSEQLERLKWSNAYVFWWEVLPELTSFSAMRLLHFATPSVVFSDLYAFAAYTSTRAAKDGYATVARLWVLFMSKKLVCLVLGIDAFLFKVRVAYRNIHQEKLGMWSMLSVSMFIVQVLGIVQLSMHLECEPNVVAAKPLRDRFQVGLAGISCTRRGFQMGCRALRVPCS